MFSTLISYESRNGSTVSVLDLLDIPHAQMVPLHGIEEISEPEPMKERDVVDILVEDVVLPLDPAVEQQGEIPRRALALVRYERPCVNHVQNL